MIAALYESFLSEMALLNKEESLAVLADWDKFFDTIDPTILIQKMIKIGILCMKPTYPFSNIFPPE